MSQDSRIRMLGRNTASTTASPAPPPSRILYKAVVMDCIQDPVLWSLQESRKINIEFVVQNAQYIDSAPRNALIVRPISDGMKGATYMIAYPFFPPHICMPVKPGEQVWLMGEKAGDLGTLPYWIARCPESAQVDDVNYTHGDRRLFTITDLSTSEVLESAQATRPIILPGFQNGDGTRSGESLSSSGLSDPKEAYEVNRDVSEWYPYLSLEPVPRLTKRPQDLVIQGSNNTAIILGEDRGWTYESRPDANARRDLRDSLGDLQPSEGAGGRKNFNGTIDIVVGRGRFLPTLPTLTGSLGSDPEATAPRTIENQWGTVETDKNPQINDLSTISSCEGDPDFKYDSARVYVSMATDGDKNFGIDTSAGNLATPFGQEFTDREAEPFVIMCSDNVRLIARKDEEKDINGSIRIVKQGTLNGDHASICLQPDGTIQISGNKIYLGRVPDQEHRPGAGAENILQFAEDGGRGGGPDGTFGDSAAGRLPWAAEKGSNPMVRYQQLENLLNAICDTFDQFTATVLTHRTPGYGHPCLQINSAASLMKSKSAQIRLMIPALASERIFGE